jgi:monoterpene epsilon-lactone hydrolase
MMAAAELEQVRKLLTAVPFNAAQPVAAARAGIDSLGDSFVIPAGVKVESVELGGTPAQRLTADGNGPVLLYLHGGGYVIGSSKSHHHVTGLLAQQMKGVVYSLDYRLAPEAPFPAARDDAVGALGTLLGRYGPARCAVAGDSAGGGLSFATLVAARDAGLPMPACVVGISPWVNLGTESGSYDRLKGLDPVLSRDVVEYFAPRYAGDRNRRDPGLSPLFAEVVGLPPTLIQIGDRECFLGDAVAMHEALIAAGVDTQLAVWKEMFHVWHLYWPMLSEGRAAVDEAAQFVAKHCVP